MLAHPSWLMSVNLVVDGFILNWFLYLLSLLSERSVDCPALRPHQFGALNWFPSHFSRPSSIKKVGASLYHMSPSPLSVFLTSTYFFLCPFHVCLSSVSLLTSRFSVSIAACHQSMAFYRSFSCSFLQISQQQQSVWTTGTSLISHIIRYPAIKPVLYLF